MSCSSSLLKAQIAYSEDFENPPPTVISTPLPPAPNAWDICSRIQASGVNCDSSVIANPNDISYLETPSFDCSFNFYVTFSFASICKLEFFDNGTIECSVDGGATWVQLISDGGPTTNCIYTGTGLFATQGNRFQEASYVDWYPGNDTLPDNTFWKTESFDISLLVGGQPDVKLRFKNADGNGNGGASRAGWFVDDIIVNKFFCEQIPPSLTCLPPNYPPTVYNLGPFPVNLYAVDASTISSITLYYSVDGVPQTPIAMTNPSDSLYTAMIPAVDTFQTVCYIVEVIDGSGCNNTSWCPGPTNQDSVCFFVEGGVTFPYCDNFDIATGLWTASAASPGSIWELGTPSYGATNSAHSPPNAWDVNLATPYTNGANTFLQSPEFSFVPVGAGATLEFWQNRNCEAGWDGTRLEYTTDTVNGPWTTLGTVGCIDCVNWYTDPAVNCSNLPAWEGSSGGWVKSSIILDATFNNLPQVWFRFAFCSDASVITDGFSIDDFCIYLPQPDDAGVASIIEPAATGPASNCVNITVEVKNYGLNNQTTFPVSYSINNGPVTTATWTGFLAPGQSVPFTFPACDTTITAGPFTICAWTSLPGDGNNFNDTTCANSLAIPVLIPTSCDDFENGNLGYQNASTNTFAAEWQLCTPAFGATTGAHSGVNAWDINLAAGYGVAVNADLYTPIYDVSTSINPYLSLWRNQNTAPNDGIRVYYEADNSGVWTVLGTVNDPDGYNWYSNISLNFTGLPGWDGNSNGWVQSRYYLQNLITSTSAQSLRFRIEFLSGFNGAPNDGVSIDDLCVVQPPPDDVGVFAIVSPTPVEPAGVCTSIQVIIRNYGTNVQTTFPVSYTINGGPVVTATWTGTLNPGQTAIFNFPCDTMPGILFDFCSWTELPGDGDTSNDTTCTEVLGIPVLTPTACDDFENGNQGYQTTTTNAFSAEWQLGTPAFGTTTGAYSGTNAWDINLTTGYGTGVNAELYTPYYDVNAAINPYLAFRRNQNTAPNDGMRISYEVNNNGIWNVLGTVGDANGYNWYTNPNIDFSGLPGWDGSTGGTWVLSRYYLQTLITSTGAQTLRFRFEFEAGFNGFPNDGISIDDICMIQPGPNDVGVVGITNPSGFSPAGNMSNVDVLIRNFGSLTQTTFPVFYSVNGGAPQQATFNGSLAPGITQSFNMPQFTVPSGQYDFCAWTELVGDSDASNDTSCATPIGVPTIILSYTTPFFDNFDATNIGWTPINATPGSIWEWGPPAYGATNSAHSAPKAWDVNLNTAYGNNASCDLYSPIFDLTNAVDPKLSFWRNHNTEQNWDGVRLEYQLNNTGPWIMLGGPNLTPPCWINWYNMPTINCSTQPAWAGATGGWVKTEATCLPMFNGQHVQFRFTFCSDASVIIDGFSIDDFRIDIPVPLTASPITVNTNTINTSFIFPGQSVQFSSPISNPGTTPLTSVNATITITPVGSSTPIFTLTDPIAYNPALASQANLPHIFTQIWNAIPGTYDVCVITSEPNGGTDLNPFDDTTCITISVFDSVSVTSSSPYCTDFESGPMWVTVNAYTYSSQQNDWQLGTPAQTIINGAFNGVNAWTIELDANYINRDTSGLFSPVFSIDNTKCYELSFMHKFDTEPFADGGTVEFSTDYAATWSQLGFASGNPQDWFNTPFITALGGSPGIPGWSGTESNWIPAVKEMQFSSGNTVIFRFRFASDNSVNNYEGWAIDQVCFKEISTPCAVGIPENGSDGLVLGQNYPNPFNGSSTVDYFLPSNGQVKIYITNLIGQEIAVPVEGSKDAGAHSFSINSRAMGPGIYYYTLEFNGNQITRKMIITE